MENQIFEIGDTCYLKSDKNKKNPMVVNNVDRITPKDFTDPFSLEIRKPPSYEPYYEIVCVWQNSQRKLESGHFQPAILTK